MDVKPAARKKLVEGEEAARMSYDLATIRTDAPIDFKPEDNLCRKPDEPRLYQLFLDLEFAKLIDKYHLTAPQGEGVAAEQPEFSASCESEVVDATAGPGNCWRCGPDWTGGRAGLPSLDGVCVTWEQGEEGHAALLLATGWSA